MSAVERLWYKRNKAALVPHLVDYFSLTTHPQTFYFTLLETFKEFCCEVLNRFSSQTFNRDFNPLSDLTLRTERCAKFATCYEAACNHKQLKIPIQANLYEDLCNTSVTSYQQV